MPFTIKVNNVRTRRRRRRRHPAPVGLARRARHDGHEVRLWHGALRRLHRAYERHADTLLHNADTKRRRRSGHDHRSDRRDDRQVRKFRRRGSISKSSNAAIASRVRSCRPRHCSRAIPIRATPISTPQCPATSAAAAPMSVFARRSSRRRKALRADRVSGDMTMLPRRHRARERGDRRSLEATCRAGISCKSGLPPAADCCSAFSPAVACCPE